MCFALSYRIVYSKVDAAKEFPHRDESGTAETVSVVWFLPFGCIGHFSNFFQPEYLDTACRAGMLRDTQPAHKSNEIDAFNSHVLHILSLT